MIKKLFLLLCLLVTGGSYAYSQDMIIKRDGTEILALKIVIEQSEIRYKKFENADGPDYILAKEEVFMIRYADGTKKVIEHTTPSKPREITTSQPKDLRIEQRGSRYYNDGNRLNDSGIRKLIVQSGNQEALAAFEEASSTGRLGKGLVIASIPLMSVGTPVLLIGTALAGFSNNRSGVYSDGRMTQLVGGGLLLAGAGSMVGGIVLKSTSKQQRQRAVELYNSGVK